ncbi:MAG: hypothetical protein SWY16_14305 [Cyanobacteriota bacterium]|nr:hypothetical protein [Cyanobacteriota bacterium]
MNYSPLGESDRARLVSQSLNYHLNVRGISAQVVISDRSCYVILIAQKMSNPIEAVSWVRQKLPEFHLSTIQRYKIYGRRIGRKLPLWCHEFDPNTSEESSQACFI